jgi:hypothetical protein
MLVKAIIGVMAVATIVKWLVDHTVGTLLALVTVILVFSMKPRKQS